MGRPQVLDRNKIKEMQEQNYTSREIAAVVGGTPRGVRDAEKAMGLPNRPGNHRGRLEQKKDKIIADYLSGMSLEDVANRHGGSKAGVYNLLANNNVEFRSGAKRQDTIVRLGFAPTKEWLEDMIKQHGTATAAAASCGLPYHTFMDWAYKLGVDVPVWRGGPGPAGSSIRQDIDVKKAIELSDQGVPYWKIGELFGVSKGVVLARLKEVDYHSPKSKMRRLPNDVSYANAPFPHKKVLAEIGATACQICGFEKVLTCAHIVPQRPDAGPTVVDNCLALCGNCHIRFDRHKKYPDQGHLTPEEFAKVKDKVDAAFTKYGSN